MQSAGKPSNSHSRGITPSCRRSYENPRIRTAGRVGQVALSRVANREKMMPKGFISRDGFGITAACRRYLEPLDPGRRLSALP